MSTLPLKQNLVKLGLLLFFTYLSVALALPVVSVFVAEKLGLANWLGGLAVGASFISTIFSRKYAGNFADLKSSKKGTLSGIGLYMAAALMCAASALGGLEAAPAFAALVAGRLVLGLGESLTMVGLTSWFIALLGPQHSGKILSVAGMAMYGAFALGGPLGLAVYQHLGFDAVMLASFLAPLIGYAMLRRTPEVPPQPSEGDRAPFRAILGTIWKQGAVVCLQGVGFAVLGAFISLYFKSHAWPYAGLGLTLFGAGFVFSRVAFGGLPDKTGGVKVALASMLVETTGQCMLWLAPGYHAALAGALLTGLGCSMIFPAMGVEVIRLVAPELRGTAFGAFAAFQDVAYALAAPMGGALADSFGYTAVFLFGSLAAALGMVMALTMLGNKRGPAAN